MYCSSLADVHKISQLASHYPDVKTMHLVLYSKLLDDQRCITEGTTQMLTGFINPLDSDLNHFLILDMV